MSWSNSTNLLTGLMLRQKGQHFWTFVSHLNFHLL